MSYIKTIEQFLKAYKNGQRVFIGLEFEHGENFQEQDLSNITFKDCWFCVDFSKTNLISTKFINCNIKTIDFTESNLTNARITDCFVDGATFTNAILKDFIFENNYYQGQTVGQKDFLELFYTTP